MTTKHSAKPRESSIELLRSVLMVLIVIHHLIVHGSHLTSVKSLPVNFATCQKLFCESFVLFPVNCFVLISGYYGIRPNITKMLSIWLQVLMYSIGIGTVFICLETIGANSLPSMVFPIITSQWWFITCYVCLMLLSPALNSLAEKSSQPMFMYLLAVGLLLNCGISFLTLNFRIGGDGSTLSHFVFLYMIGRYLRVHEGSFAFSRVKLLVCYVACCLSIAFASIVSCAYFSSAGVWTLYRFNNPIIVLQAICIFLLFRQIHFTSRIINKIGGLGLAVYLIHDHRLVRSVIYDHLFMIDKYSSGWAYAVYLIVFAFVICAASVFIEWLRQWTSRPILSAILKADWFGCLESKMHRRFIDR